MSEPLNGAATTELMNPTAEAYVDGALTGFTFQQVDDMFQSMVTAALGRATLVYPRSVCPWAPTIEQYGFHSELFAQVRAAERLLFPRH